MTTTEEFKEYLVQVHNCAQRDLRRRNVSNADDISSNVVLTASTKGHDLMNRYPATTYARIRSGHALIEFDRAERAQRGQGTRLRHLPDGIVEPMRTVTSLNLDYLNDRAACVSGNPEDPLFAAELYNRVKKIVGAQLAKAFHDIAVHDRPIKSVAADLGIRPETLSRKLNECRRNLQANLLPTGEFTSS